MFSYFALPPQGSTAWQNPMIQHNPYPPPPPPPQLVHKVWILDCKSCGTFLTNRGMKAVLLLRPNVSLFSTDALPINCSAYSTNPDALRPPPCRPSTSSSPARTCECLTQTLCCHTCGSAVGYMIVIPCSRCTSSITATNRATNGHRFVFHSSEIVASERHHVPDEPGVIPVDYPAPPSTAPPLTSAYPALMQPPLHLSGSPHRIVNSIPSQSFPPPPPVSSPSPGTSYLPTPPLEVADLGPLSASSSPDPFSFINTGSPRRSPRPLPRSPSPLTPLAQPQLARVPSQPGTGTSTPEPRGLPIEQREAPVRKLKAGDVLYWHHLAKNGEIPGVEEDSRARIPKRVNPHKFLDR
ncbi:hypothetical protein BV22DRAFT_1008886 [Leucogyrophana mollusca]|uniref:Uncharacterized protein n=1 Tax=Leucogyrophana mollusca TaxID=85980 RepID=A0ACB8BMZ0_9AGAM|nr:hypothetical protein BV22DRAFT_1008886 [Leucogyrophana mollusca]